MTDYACQIACAGCRKTGHCAGPSRAVPHVREEDPFSAAPFRQRYTERDTRAPAKGVYLACGCTIPEVIIVLIGTKGQQVYCFDHKQFTRIKPETIAAAKRKHKKTIAAGQGVLDVFPF